MIQSLTSGTDKVAPTLARQVYVIDDDVDVRKSLHFLLTTAGVAAWSFADAADFLNALDGLRPAPILLDVRMPGIDGLDLLALLVERDISWPVIMMTAHGDVPIAVRAMKLGATEFLEKPFPPEMLDQALARAFAMLDIVLVQHRTRDEARGQITALSTREREVLTVLIKGIANKEAAARLGLSTRTVEMHRASALAKLRRKSIAEVMTLWLAADLAAGPGNMG
ncbi:response regulator transcription factor [Sphingomonas japonica]|uniref:Two-component system response regulator FixJ n=1 Tax=Sphingomonas japonica TaxID=511662 RepID=A0ABX0U3Y2_9SPHN|nr:response regulator [Sphingomonas japonica]NIJ25213.1 two-component system response regulator FixJ [Sphingomonas japonica]